MLKHILVPLDGTALAEKALDTVQYILPTNGKITLLTVVPNPDPLPTVPVEGGEIPIDQYLEHIALRVRLEGFEVETDIRAGDVAEVITQTAVTLGVEIIAMCGHERNGLEQLIGSSVTQRVLAISLCPVLVIPPTNRERAPQPMAETETAPDVNLGLDVA
ncbi:MAG: universal stress protein [Anaerolineae bacterium]|nr:universal stress protein [Anaerolineae bacterium]